MKGWERGLTLGFVRGACKAWLEGEGEAERGALEKVMKGCDAFPKDNVVDDDAELKLQVVQAKFRVARARLKRQDVDLAKVIGDGGERRTTEF